MGRISNCFHLRNFEVQWGEWPGDKLIIFREVTLAGTETNGTATVDLTTIVREGAFVQWWILNHATVSNNTFAIETAVPGIGATVTIGIIVAPEDLL